MLLGQFCYGGFYAGVIEDDSKKYNIIMSPLEGQGRYQYGEKSNNPSFCSITNGWNTSNLMSISGDYPAAIFCRNLKIGGYNDWYLPSLMELDILYQLYVDNILQENQMKNTNYLSSTLVDGMSTYQYFYNGRQGQCSTNSKCHVRAIRRIAI